MAGNSDVDINVRVNASEAAAGFKYAQTLASTFSHEVVSKFASIAGAAAVAKGAFDAVTEAMSANAAMAKQIGGLSSKFHIEPKEVHSLLLAANDAGVSVRSLMMGMKSLGAVASKGLMSKENAEVFKNLGADLDNLGSIAAKPAASFAEMATLLMQIGNEQDRAAYGAKLFGRQYQQLLPLIEKVGKDAEARRKFLDNENAMSNAEIAALREQARLQSEMKETWEKLVAVWSRGALAITGFVSMIAKALMGTKGLAEEWRKVNAEWKSYDTNQKAEKQEKFDTEAEIYKEDIANLNVERMKGEKAVIDPELRKRIEAFERGKVVAGTGTFAGANEGKSGFISVDGRMVPIDAANGKAIGGGLPVWKSPYTNKESTDILPQLATSGLQVLTTQVGAELEARQREIAQIEAEFGSNSVVKGIMDLNRNNPNADFNPTHLIASSGDENAPKYTNRFSFGEQGKKEFAAARRLRELTTGTSQLTYGKNPDGSARTLEQYWAGDKPVNMGMVPHLKEQMKELETKGNLVGKAQKDSKAAEATRAYVSQQLNPILQSFIDARGMSGTHYVEDGKIIEGVKPQEQWNRQVEDVDAPQKKKKADQAARALRKKENARLMETEEMAGYRFRAKVTEEERVQWQKEEVDPKKAAMDAIDAALKTAQAEAAATRNWKIVPKGQEAKLDVLTKDEDRAGTGTDGKVIAGSAKEKFLKWKTATDLVDQLKTQSEGAKKDYDSAYSTQIDNENAAKKARIALQQKEITESVEFADKVSGLDRTRHERKLKYMQMEGKTQKEINEESFKFELSKLQQYYEEYTELKADAESEGSMGGSVITKEEQDILDKALSKVEGQAGKAEGAMLKAANTPGWQVMSDMRSIGGGGKILGTSANTALKQLAELQKHSPLLQSMDASLKRMLGVDAPVKTGATESKAVYAPSKGNVPAKPAVSPYYRDSSGNVQDGSDMNDPNPSSDYEIPEDYES